MVGDLDDRVGPIGKGLAQETSVSKIDNRRDALIPTEGSRVVCTVGYQLRSPQELVEELREAGVDVVIDVRETPWSYVPGYREAALRQVLEAAGIEYVHARFAGNPKDFRKQANSHAECLATYREHLAKHPEIAQELAELLRELSEQDRKSCLLCYERHPDDCHRKTLVEAIGLEESVQHLGPDGAPRLLKS